MSIPKEGERVRRSRSGTLLSPCLISKRHLSDTSLFTCLSIVSLLHENRDLASPVHCLISSFWNSAWCTAGPQELFVE